MVSLPAPILPDVLAPGLRVVFCGYAPGTASARAGAYYAGPGNRFWLTLHEVGLTPLLLLPAEFARLPEFGLGLTDASKTASGSDREVGRRGVDPARLARQRPPPTSPSTARTRHARYSAERSTTDRSPSGSAVPPSGSSPRPPAPPAASGTSSRGGSWRVPRCRLQVPHRGLEVDWARTASPPRGSSRRPSSGVGGGIRSSWRRSRRCRRIRPRGWRRGGTG